MIAFFAYGIAGLALVQNSPSWSWEGEGCGKAQYSRLKKDEVGNILKVARHNLKSSPPPQFKKDRASLFGLVRSDAGDIKVIFSIERVHDVYIVYTFKKNKLLYRNICSTWS